MLGSILSVVVGQSVRVEGLVRPSAVYEREDEVMGEEQLEATVLNIPVEQLAEYRLYSP